MSSNNLIYSSIQHHTTNNELNKLIQRRKLHGITFISIGLLLVFLSIWFITFDKMDSKLIALYPFIFGIIGIVFGLSQINTYKFLLSTNGVQLFHDKISFPNISGMISTIKEINVKWNEVNSIKLSTKYLIIEINDNKLFYIPRWMIAEEENFIKGLSKTKYDDVIIQT